jgi:hypothetical protein
MKTVKALALGALLALSHPLLAQDPEKKGDAGAQKPAEGKVEITVEGARNDEEAKARLHADSLLSRCVIKPVMTDEEIDLCRRAYLLTRRAAAGMPAR